MMISPELVRAIHEDRVRKVEEELVARAFRNLRDDAAATNLLHRGPRAALAQQSSRSARPLLGER